MNPVDCVSPAGDLGRVQDAFPPLDGQWWKLTSWPLLILSWRKRFDELGSISCVKFLPQIIIIIIENYHHGMPPSQKDRVPEPWVARRCLRKEGGPLVRAVLIWINLLVLDNNNVSMISCTPLLRMAMSRRWCPSVSTTNNSCLSLLSVCRFCIRNQLWRNVKLCRLRWEFPI